MIKKEEKRKEKEKGKKRKEGRKKQTTVMYKILVCTFRCERNVALFFHLLR